MGMMSCLDLIGQMPDRKNGLIQKKLYPLLSIFWSWPPGIFHFFCINPFENPRFSLKFWHTPWNSQLLSLYPLEIFIDILNKGEGIQIFSGRAQYLFSYFFRFVFLLHFTWLSSLGVLLFRFHFFVPGDSSNIS